MKKKKIVTSPKEIVKAMGLVFGDIGTNPIFLRRLHYAFVRFHDLPYNKLHGVVTRLNL